MADDQKIVLKDVEETFPYIGQFGRFQIRLLVILTLMKIPQSAFILMMYFVAMNPSWKCAENSVECSWNHTFSSDDQLRCNMSREAWQYTESKTFSLVTEFDLVCGKEWIIYLCSSVYFLGWAIGSLVFGNIGDLFGRRKALFPSFIAMLVVGGLSVLSPTPLVFAASRFLIGFFNAGMIMSLYVLATEFVSSKHRPVPTLIFSFLFPIGSILLACAAYLIKDWKVLLLIFSLPFLPLMLCWRLVPESIRWLHSRGRLSKVEKLISKIAESNGRKLSKPLTLVEKDISFHEGKANLVELFRKRPIRNLSLILGLSWFALNLVYYGASLAASDLGVGDPYVNFILSLVIEMPSIVISYVGCYRYGRKKTVSYTTILGAIFCLAVAFLPNVGNLSKARLVCGISGKFFLTVPYWSILIWTVELYPTYIRSTGLGYSCVVGRIGGVAAPWVAKALLPFHYAAPFLAMGIIGLMSGITMLWLPETKDLTETDLNNKLIYNGQKKDLMLLDKK